MRIASHESRASVTDDEKHVIGRKRMICFPIN